MGGTPEMCWRTRRKADEAVALSVIRISVPPLIGVDEAEQSESLSQLVQGNCDVRGDHALRKSLLALSRE